MLDVFEAQNCAIVEEWLARLEQALTQPGSQSLNALFLSQSYWRDVLALTWNIQTLCGAETISDVIAERSKDAGLSNIQVELADMRWDRNHRSVFHFQNKRWPWAWNCSALS